MNEEIEVWKDIPNYEGLYQVSNLGRVKSLIKHNGTNERILKQSSDGNNYFFVGLFKNKKVKNYTVHVLVAMSFNGHTPDGTRKVVVDHIDNNRLNNRADNIRLTTPRDNTTKDRKGGTSKYIGVHFDKKNKKWIGTIFFKNRHICLGYFKLEIEASNAYNKALDEINKGLDLNVLYPKRKKKNKYKYVYLLRKGKSFTAIYKGKYIGIYKTEEEAHESVQKYIN